jgi:hypothetical protein
MDVDIEKTPKVKSRPILYCYGFIKAGQHLVGIGLGFASCKRALQSKSKIILA